MNAPRKDAPPPWGAEAQHTPTSHGRVAPEEAVTVIANFLEDSDVPVPPPARVREEEATPIVTKNHVPPAPSRLTGPRMFALGLLLVACGFMAFRAISRASFSREMAAETARIEQANKREAERAAAEAKAKEPPAEEPVREATPAQAARSFSIGDYERALAQYRYLAKQHPEVGAYAVMVKVLSAQRRER